VIGGGGGAPAQDFSDELVLFAAAGIAAADGFIFQAADVSPGGGGQAVALIRKNLIRTPPCYSIFLLTPVRQQGQHIRVTSPLYYPVTAGYIGSRTGNLFPLHTRPPSLSPLPPPPPFLHPVYHLFIVCYTSNLVV
jgi:hypothetical protein